MLVGSLYLFPNFDLVYLWLSDRTGPPFNFLDLYDTRLALTATTLSLPSTLNTLNIKYIKNQFSILGPARLGISGFILLRYIFYF